MNGFIKILSQCENDDNKTVPMIIRVVDIIGINETDPTDEDYPGLGCVISYQPGGGSPAMIYTPMLISMIEEQLRHLGFYY